MARRGPSGNRPEKARKAMQDEQIIRSATGPAYLPGTHPAEERAKLPVTGEPPQAREAAQAPASPPSLRLGGVVPLSLPYGPLQPGHTIREKPHHLRPTKVNPNISGSNGLAVIAGLKAQQVATSPLNTFANPLPPDGRNYLPLYTLFGMLNTSSLWSFLLPPGQLLDRSV